MNNPQIGALANFDTSTATASYIVLSTGLWLDEFYGNFQYDVFGELAGGTLNRWIEKYNGQLVFDVSQASVPVSTFLSWVASDANLTAAQTIFAGDDNITGSAFSDILRGWSGSDLINAGGGEDNVDAGAGADTVYAGVGDDVVRDTGGINYLRGDDGNDRITGGADFDDINGNLGNDTASGGLGDDWVVGGKDNDVLYGEAGGDIVYGNLGDDTCSGDDGADIVRGGQANDLVQGGAGDDWLSGDRGDDTVSGGTGADIFHTFGDAGLDRVTDFKLAEGDRVMLDPGTTYTVAQVGADTVITMGGGGQMTLVGVQASSLTPGWIFGA